MSHEPGTINHELSLNAKINYSFIFSRYPQLGFVVAFFGLFYRKRLFCWTIKTIQRSVLIEIRLRFSSSTFVINSNQEAFPVLALDIKPVSAVYLTNSLTISYAHTSELQAPVFLPLICTGFGSSRSVALFCSHAFSRSFTIETFERT